MSINLYLIVGYIRKALRKMVYWENTNTPVEAEVPQEGAISLSFRGAKLCQFWRVTRSVEMPSL